MPLKMLVNAKSNTMIPVLEEELFVCKVEAEMGRLQALVYFFLLPKCLKPDFKQEGSYW